MFKISDEFKTIPSWFTGFDPKKLIDHPVDMIKYQIWLIQLGAALSVVFSMTLSAVALMGGIGSFAIFISLVGVLFLQVLILGIHARSKLAWLLLATNAVQLTFSMLFILGLILFYMINQDETVAYFRGESVHVNPSAEPTLNS